MKARFRCQGNVELIGEVGDAQITTMMHGHLFARQLKTSTLKLKAMSHGNSEVYATGQISIKHMSHGYIHYYGTAILKDVIAAGHGSIKHCE